MTMSKNGMRAFAVACASVAGISLLNAETASSMSDQAISVNTCEGELRAVSPKDVEYSPSWCGEGE